MSATNRSSKNHYLLRPKCKSVVRSWSNEQLAKAGSGDKDVAKERERRAKKHEKMK